MIDLRNGDCLELIKTIPDNSIDMIFSDLPYGKHTTGCKWDKDLPLKQVFDEFRRIIKEDGCIALNGTFKFGMDLYHAAPDLYKYEWIWEKDNGTNVPAVNYQPFRVHEYVFIFGKGRVSNGTITPMKYNPQKVPGKPYENKTHTLTPNYHGGLGLFTTKNESGLRHPRTVQYFKRDKEHFHSTQKPVEMCKYFIKTYTNEGDTVLDITCGSGSTLVACKETNRNGIGFELNKEFYEIAKRRLAL